METEVSIFDTELSVYNFLVKYFLHLFQNGVNQPVH
jgi:hypothetical protein